MNRAVVILILLLAAVGTLVAIDLSWRRGCTPSPSPRFSSGPTVEQLERLGHLVVGKVRMADVLVAEDDHWRGSWLIKGDALLAVDMREAVIADRDDDEQLATIRLPPPRVLHPRVDHARSSTWSVEKTTWIPGALLGEESDRLRDAAMRHAQAMVEHAAGSSEHLDEARAMTAALIKSCYQMVGWHVEVCWSDQ